MTIFISGGCKNGKSTYALKQALQLAGQGPRYYIATLDPKDDEQLACVKVHREARKGKGFITFESPVSLPACPEGADPCGVFLLDSVTALLFNEMFSSGGNMDPSAPERIIESLDRFLDTVKHAVLVSDYIYSDGMGYAPVTEAYARGLAQVDRFLTQKCERVVEICMGIPTVYKDLGTGKDTR